MQINFRFDMVDKLDFWLTSVEVKAVKFYPNRCFITLESNKIDLRDFDLFSFSC